MAVFKDVLESTDAVKEKSQLTVTSNVGSARSHESSYVVYLKDVLGKILPKALNDICERRPTDPIEELARWLYQWADCELYYYEKAIFAKELQLLALQLEKENANRMAKLMALKREMAIIKHVLANDKLMAMLMWKEKGGLFGEGFLDAGMLHDLAKDHMKEFGRDEFVASVSGLAGRSEFSSRKSSADYDIDSSRRKSRRFDTSRMSMSDESRLDQRRRRRKSDSDAEDFLEGGKKKKKGRRESEYDEFGRKKRGRRVSEYDEFGRKKRGRRVSEYDEFGRKKRGKSLSSGASSGASLYGEAAKLKYGFAFTPVKCSWYLIEPNILVCVHPVLGEIRAPLTIVMSLLDSPEWWERHSFSFQTVYDHELYINEDPHFDDDEYRDQMMTWGEDEWIDQFAVEDKEAEN